MNHNTLYEVQQEINITGDNEQDYVMCWIATQANADSAPQDEVYSLKQKLVYAYYGTWAKAHNLRYSYTKEFENDTDVKKKLSEARSKYQGWKKADSASIKNNTTTSSIKKEVYNYNGQSYIKVGPFNFTYTGANPDVVFNITNQNGSKVSVLYGRNENGTFRVTSGFQAEDYSGKDFYLLVNINSNARYLNLQVNLTDNIWNYSGTVSILQADGTDPNMGKSWQNVIHLVGKIDKTSKKQRMEMNNIPLTGDLEITKQDKDTSGNLNNVGFVLYNTQLQKYVASSNSNGMATYTSNRSQAKEFITGVDGTTGKITVKGLIAGQYEIYETKNPNYGYEQITGDKKVSTVTVSPGNAYSKGVNDSKRTIADGYYEIESALKSGMVVDLASGITTDSTNIQLYQRNNSAAQQFYVEYIGNGYYIIHSAAANNKVLDVQSGSTASGANVQIYTSNNSSAQKWAIRDAGGGYYYIVNQGGGKYLDVQGGHTDNGTNIQVYNGNSRNSQKFKFNSKTTSLEKKVTITNQKQTGNIKIVKKDANNNSIVLPGITFKIKNASGQYIIAVDSNGKVQKQVTGTIHLGNIQTTTNINNATSFITDSNGNIRIYNLRTGKYQVVETSVGNNFGYEVGDGYITWSSNVGNGSGNNSSVNVTRETSTNTGTSAGTGDNLFDILTIKNKRAYIKIRGYAWEEKTDGKNSTKDYTWNSGTEDKRLANITVRLKNSKGQTLGTATTNTNGEYVFGNYDTDSKAIKLKIDDLVGAYIEFEYNGMSYQSINVESQFIYQSSTRTYYGNKNTATDSALREKFNNNYATISQGISSNTNGNKTYDIKYNYDSTNHKSTVVYGDSVKYGYQGQKYPISGTYAQYTIQAVTAKSSTNALCTQLTPQKLREQAIVEIGGLNLGLEERSMPDLAVVEDMDNVQISLNGYTHTYEYARRFDDPSEYAGGDPFNTTVKFANKYLTNSYSREVYSSDIVYNQQNKDSLQVFVTYRVQLRNESSDVYSNLKTLTNYYDARYENVVVKDENGKELTSQIDNSYNKNGMKKVNIQTNYQIPHGQTREITITYELNNDAINAILNGDITLDSVTEVSSYSSYSDNGYKVPYAGIDIDSAPDTVDPSNVPATIEDDTDRAPSLILTVREGRIITGTVWEDSAIQTLLEQSGYNKERKGNGVYDANENVVNDVTVDLLIPAEGGNYGVAQLYKMDGTVENATTTTGTTGTIGEYTFSGVIPGDYVLRFTYGNNSVIVDSSGNTVGNVVVDNYKSTIYRGGNEPDGDEYWYRKETSKSNADRLSDARDTFGIKEDGTRIDDIVQNRTTQDENINYETVTQNRLSSISADTENFEIELDYDVDDINLEHISKYNNQLVLEFDNIDFGIIERPRQDLEVDKQVANIQITLANGTTLINGDPRSQNLSGVRVLDNHDVYIEMDNELIQGANLTVTYEISVDNSNCEVDYNDENYYIYGTVPTNKENKYKITTVVDMYDYLPDELLFQENMNSNWEKTTINDSDNGTILSEEVYENVKGLQNIVHLKTPVFEDMTPGSRKVDTTLVVSRQLSTSSDDLTYENDIEIIQLKGRATYSSTPGNYDPTTNTPDEQDDGHVPVTITGPTGENRQYIVYGVLGISLLITIGVGIVFIKKKVL